MKKFLSFISVILLLACFGFSTILGVSAEASPNQKLDNFVDDFESYEVNNNYIENNSSFKNKWENNVLKGGEAQLMDSHLGSIGKVEYENGSSGNKVLHLNNAAVPQNTFFYVGPSGDYRVKNFTATFDVKFLTESVTESSWIGISFRKKSNVHYTGTNNLMYVIQRQVNSISLTGHAYAMFNGGSENNLEDSTVKSLYGDKLSISTNAYAIPNAVENQPTDWIRYKLVVNEKNYKIYANDFLLLNCNFNINSFDYFGYISLNCCTSNVLVDNFNIRIDDEVAPPRILPLETPQLVLDEDKKQVTWNKIAGASLYAVYINDELVQMANKTTYVFKDDLSNGEYKVTVQAISEDNFISKDSNLSNTVIYTVGDIEKGESCSSSITTVGLYCSMIGLVIAYVVIKRKRKNAREFDNEN